MDAFTLAVRDALAEHEMLSMALMGTIVLSLAEWAERNGYALFVFMKAFFGAKSAHPFVWAHSARLRTIVPIIAIVSGGEEWSARPMLAFLTTLKFSGSRMFCSARTSRRATVNAFKNSSSSSNASSWGPLGVPGRSFSPNGHRMKVL